MSGRLTPSPAATQRGSWIGALLVIAGVLTVAGMGIATYLTFVHYADQPIVCGSIGDCELVNSSTYASMAGLPVALLGAGAYASMLLLIAGAWLRRSPELLLAAWGVALASFGFSMYLTYIELRVLDAICVYCVASASITTALLAVLSVCLWFMRGELLGDGDGEEPQIGGDQNPQMSQIRRWRLPRADEGYGCGLWEAARERRRLEVGHVAHGHQMTPAAESSARSREILAETAGAARAQQAISRGDSYRAPP